MPKTGCGPDCSFFTANSEGAINGEDLPLLGLILGRQIIVSVFQDGKPIVITNAEGCQYAFRGFRGEDSLVGISAQQGITNPQNTFTPSKDLWGCPLIV